MPLYEYRCQACGKVFEVIRKFSDEPLKTHEACGGAVERLLSAPSFQFKGTGWYVTDYGRKSNGSGEKNGASKTAESKSESKTEKKSEAPSTTAKKD